MIAVIESVIKVSTLLFVAYFLFLSPVYAGGQAHTDTWNVVLDFMVQDVCVDANGLALAGISPLDSRCSQHRNLLPGEVLTYHKHDWPGDEDKKTQLHGYQRSDSFPYISRALGNIVIQTFDFGSGGRSFGKFEDGDGGQIIAFSKNSASIVMTEDGGGGFQLFAGAKCRATKIEPSFFHDSWLIVGKSSENIAAGNDIAILRIIKTLSCPTSFDYAYTEWHFADISYRTSLEGGLRMPMHTLVSSHFGGKTVSSADHLEKFYFTRELGLTRWERWQNTKYSKDGSHDSKRAQKLAISGRCRNLESVPGGGWLMVDCREWTNITGSEMRNGDSAIFWVDRLRTNPLSQQMIGNQPLQPMTPDAVLQP